MPAWSDEDVTLLAAVMRHDTTNVLQVLGGWLQMGERAQAKAVLDEMQMELGQEGRTLNACPTWLASLLLVTCSRAKAAGITVRLRAGGRLPAEAEPTVQHHIWTFLQVCRELAIEADPSEFTCTVGVDDADLLCEFPGLAVGQARARMGSVLNTMAGAGLAGDIDGFDLKPAEHLARPTGIHGAGTWTPEALWPEEPVGRAASGSGVVGAPGRGEPSAGTAGPEPWQSARTRHRWATRIRCIWSVRA